MLSVLIPTYNYNVQELVVNIHKQLIANAIDFEIIIFEDGSNSNINSNILLSHTICIVNVDNIGRVKARQSLAKIAKYDWLLFLDADVLPKYNTHIEQFLKNIGNNEYHAIFGGFAYYKSKPKDDYLLRWTYGRSKEQVPASKRNKTPYKVIISANFLIKKTVFLHITSLLTKPKGYGFDNYLGALLKQKKINVLHIDNEVYHLGIEKSSVFIDKTEQAAKTLLKLHRSEHKDNYQNDWLNLFIKLKKYRITKVFSVFYKWFGKPLKNNLLGKNPSITVFQLYKISYICHLNNKITV